ncbi:hypothetical protein IQ07DRAFT_596314 [Pyrenochaeta sp. DS3sAY3a]|nr:hypothetical protein IQ07DRAFT_596314 [Pyrenochaeta sp. DS3sAY3a]
MTCEVQRHSTPVDCSAKMPCLCRVCSPRARQRSRRHRRHRKTSLASAGALAPWECTASRSRQSPPPALAAIASLDARGRCKAAQASNRLSLPMPKSGISAIDEWICPLSNGRRFSRWVPAITEQPSIDWLSCAGLATSRPTSFANAPPAPVTVFQNGARAP